LLLIGRTSGESSVLRPPRPVRDATVPLKLHTTDAYILLVPPPPKLADGAAAAAAPPVHEPLYAPYVGVLVAAGAWRSRLLVFLAARPVTRTSAAVPRGDSRARSPQTNLPGIKLDRLDAKLREARLLGHLDLQCRRLGFFAAKAKSEFFWSDQISDCSIFVERRHERGFPSDALSIKRQSCQVCQPVNTSLIPGGKALKALECFVPMKHSAFECTKSSEHLSAFSTECSHTFKALGT